MTYGKRDVRRTSPHVGAHMPCGEIPGESNPPRTVSHMAGVREMVTSEERPSLTLGST